MKVVNKKKSFIIIPILFLVLSVCLISNVNNQESRLSEAEITLLREKYPVCGLNVPVGLSMNKLSLSDAKNIAETFVYGKVVGDVKTYTVNLSTGNSTLDEKRRENGISDEFDFYEYTIVVIDDTEGIKKKGENITIASNMVFKDYHPQLSEGMMVVVPVVADKKVPTRNSYTVHGMYYVTEDGYAISAFEETDTLPRNMTSGVKVEKLLEQLKK